VGYEGNDRRLLEINFVGIYMKDLGNPQNILDSWNSGRKERKDKIRRNKTRYIEGKKNNKRKNKQICDTQ
jgi:hypothetical protein